MIGDDSILPVSINLCNYNNIIMIVQLLSKILFKSVSWQTFNVESDIFYRELKF